MDWQKSSLREALGKTLEELGHNNPDVVVVNADLVNSVKSNYFRNAFPERTIEVGIAEQNMIGIAAGLSRMGFIPFALTFARFASKRAADQISMCVDYSKNNVKVIGAYAGIFTGRQGVSQQTIEDTATLRAMPNMMVLDAADIYETRALIMFAAEYQGPVYIRVGRDEWPVVFDKSYRFEPGRGRWLKTGGDVAILNSGLLLYACLDAAEILSREGIDAAVINMPCVKPLDEAMIRTVAKDIGAIVTVENHSILGGFGGAVAEIVVESHPALMKRIGIRDVYSESAPNEDLAEKYGLTARHIADAAREIHAKKKGLEGFRKPRPEL